MSTRDHKPSRAELQNGRLLWRAVPRTAVLFGSGVGTLLLLVASAMAQDKPNEAIKVDKEKKTVTIACISQLQCGSQACATTTNNHGIEAMRF